MRKEYRCFTCGMQRLTLTAEVRFNPKTQTFDVLTVDPTKADCGFCKGIGVGVQELTIVDETPVSIGRVWETITV